MFHEKKLKQRNNDFKTLEQWTLNLSIMKHFKKLDSSSLNMLIMIHKQWAHKKKFNWNLWTLNGKYFNWNKKSTRFWKKDNQDLSNKSWDLKNIEQLFYRTVNTKVQS